MQQVIIACHHKTGTNFWIKFLQDLKSRPQRYTIDLGGISYDNDWDILLDRHSVFATSEKSSSCKGIHSIRHPFSLIYSAALYHCRARESWLHEPKSFFDGLTYQQKILSFDTIEDKLMFEMNNSSGSALRRMASLYHDKRFYNVRLENICHDSNMTDLANAFAFIDLSGNELNEWLQISAKHCLWNLSTLPNHCTTGVSKEFLQYFKGAVLSEFRRNYGELELAMGYTSC